MLAAGLLARDDDVGRFARHIAPKDDDPLNVTCLFCEVPSDQAPPGAGWGMRPRARIWLPVFALAIAAVTFGRDTPSTAPEGDWQDVQMVSFANPEDFADLRAAGINVVLQNVTQDPAAWEKYYAAAVKHELRLVPVLWSVHQTAWQWNEKNGEWELGATRYPNSVGARFLRFLKANPKHLAATFALYSFHEPHNPETPKGRVDCDRQRKFWRQIHEREFPGAGLKVYGESISWHKDARNGCVDYDGWSLIYPFVTIKGQTQYRPMHWVVGKGLGGIEQWPDPPTPDFEKAKASARRLIESLHHLIQKSLPAPDGSRTRLIILMQTYSIDGRTDLWNRMPSAEEMRQWGLEVVGARKAKVAGLNWYCYRKAASFYTHCLALDRIDASGQDRLAAVRQVAEALRRPLAPPNVSASRPHSSSSQRR